MNFGLPVVPEDGKMTAVTFPGSLMTTGLQ